MSDPLAKVLADIKIGGHCYSPLEEQLAAEVVRLRTMVADFRDAEAARQTELIGLLTAETPGQPPREDHEILDIIKAMFDKYFKMWSMTRESECLEFYDRSGQRYEVVCRPIGAAEAEETDHV